MTGKNGAHPVDVAHLPLHATVVLDPPAAATGECLEASWSGVSPTPPSCIAAGGGAVVKCK